MEMGATKWRPSDFLFLAVAAMGRQAAIMKSCTFVFKLGRFLIRIVRSYKDV